MWGLALDEIGFPGSLPETDRTRWGSMTVSQRARARTRLQAIEAWQGGDLLLEVALKVSGLSRTRFYTVAAEYRASRTLASLGAFAGSGAARQRLNPNAVNALQSVVADVVAMNRGASISQLVRLMVEASSVDETELPGSTRLRDFVEAELRRVDATGQAGHALKLDYSAINLPQADGRPYIMFTLIDEGTRLLLGAWTGVSPDEDSGYSNATLNALERVSELSALKWVDRLMRIEITVGSDREKAAKLRSRLLTGGVHANVQLAPARFGRYIRKFVGQRIGRVEITPARTESGPALPDNGDMTPWTAEEAADAVDLAVDQHNEEILANLQILPGRPAMPDDMELALHILTTSR